MFFLILVIQESSYIGNNEVFVALVIKESVYIEDKDVFWNNQMSAVIIRLNKIGSFLFHMHYLHIISLDFGPIMNNLISYRN